MAASASLAAATAAPAVSSAGGAALWLANPNAASSTVARGRGAIHGAGGISRRSISERRSRGGGGSSSCFLQNGCYKPDGKGNGFAARAHWTMVGERQQPKASLAGAAAAVEPHATAATTVASAFSPTWPFTASASASASANLRDSFRTRKERRRQPAAAAAAASMAAGGAAARSGGSAVAGAHCAWRPQWAASQTAQTQPLCMCETSPQSRSRGCVGQRQARCKRALLQTMLAVANGGSGSSSSIRGSRSSTNGRTGCRTSGQKRMAAVAATASGSSATSLDSVCSSGSSSSRGDASGAGAKHDSAGGNVVRWQHEGLYSRYVEHCTRRMRERMDLSHYPIPEEWRELKGEDGTTGEAAVCRSVAGCAPKIRFFRSADISAGPDLQVLNLIAFPDPRYDLPYFCADLVTFPRGHLVVVDLNPLYQSNEYLNKYFVDRPIMEVCSKFNKVLPWGGEFTSESLQFFSPSLIWSRLPLTRPTRPTPASAAAAPLDAAAAAVEQAEAAAAGGGGNGERGSTAAAAALDAHEVALQPVFEAFCEYLEVWLDMVDACEEETDPAVVAANREAQHRYMCWRTEKDPGRPVLTRLFGSERCEEYIRGFLFDGMHLFGADGKGFLDYFPQYRLPDGSICRKRSMAGKSFSARPWDESGRLLPLE